MQRPSMIATMASVTIAAMLPLPAKAHNPHETQAHYAGPTIFVTAVADQTKLNATKAALRDLWNGHVFWIRNVVVAELAGNAAAQKAAESQVVANAHAIANSIEPFYGAEAKEQMFKLLVGHYGAVTAYLDSAIAKDAARQSKASAALSTNARDIAVFLSAANPFLPMDTVEGLLQAHGGHHIIQIQQLQSKDYGGEAQTWSEMTQHVYVIADATADALAQQFTERF
jgi:hypothetical protein